ncbi:MULTISPECIES: hypothetical protein [unclassified Pseudoalteromonas]|uniref:hypothetical protein n=1 Tax=unclassified Pseudoalteromonas TaxID=194690 RepID=UPI001EEFE063|nr:hypothetical protein [Pseudoalteromonas sp. L21]MCF7518635.1 hypothetical protein [Pseudoalteromonas sp. L21]UJX26521.1 hypothetical protein L3Q70_05010 [Pseudoalteromonas sp. CF6-2]|tara:strand:- start:2832 stop:3485 length:654 start_codon:yes stop_codon:yes gene_type:complete
MKLLSTILIFCLLAGCNSAEDEVFNEDDLYEPFFSSDYYVYNFSEYPIDFYMMNLRNSTSADAIYKQHNYQQSVDAYNGFTKLSFKRSTLGNVGFAAFYDDEIKAQRQKWIANDTENYLIVYEANSQLKLGFLARTNAIDITGDPMVRLVSFAGDMNYTYKRGTSLLLEEIATSYLPITDCGTDLQIIGYEYDFCSLESRGYLVLVLPNQSLAIIEE